MATTIYVPRLFGGMLILGNVLTQVVPNTTLYVRSGVVEQSPPVFAPVSDDYSPIYAGDTGAIFAPRFLHKSSNTPVDLVNATISMKMQSDTGLVQTCNGAWTLVDALGGLAYYSYQAADVATPGEWSLYITITIGGLPVHADVKYLSILPSI